MTIIFNTVGRREQELNTSLWVRMYVQKTVIHIIFYKKNNMNQMTKFVLNEETLAPHINSNLDSNKLIQLWDNKESMTKFLTNCLFQVKSKQELNVMDCNMEFWTTFLNLMEVNSKKYCKRGGGVGLQHLKGSVLISCYQYIITYVRI